MDTHRDVSTVFSRAPAGLEAPMVRVEVHLGTGLPAFNLVGLPEAVVRESKERVRAALVTAGYEFPQRRITVNLCSAVVAQRVAVARSLQLGRQGRLNARLTPSEVSRFCVLTRDSRALLGSAISRLGLSARAYHRVLKVARTCADLRGDADIRMMDVAEAVKLRALDRPSG
jgi:predicted ATPase with chaperone activity